MILYNYLNYIAFCFRFNFKKLFIFIINLILLIYSIVVQANTTNSQAQPLTYIVLGINIMWQSLSLFNDIYTWSKTIFARIEANPQNFSTYAISNKEKDNNFKLIVHGNSALVSDDVNSWLQSVNTLNAYRDKGKEKRQKIMVKKDFENFRTILKCKLQESSRIGFYNNCSLCLSDDIGFNESAIGLYKGDYYTSYLTNLSFSYRIRHDDGSLQFTPLYTKYNGKLPDIRCSDMNNSIGVSTIAFSKDGYIFCLQQNTKADSSAGMLTPSGSGVSNWSDYEKGNFIRSILNATNRELFEECGGYFYKDIAKETKSKIIGFFRWLDKGGKPEFISVSVINKNISDIFPQPKEQTLEIISEHIKNNITGRIEWDTLFTFLDKIQQNSMCSFPLYMCIYTLRRYIQKDKEQFEKEINDLQRSICSNEHY